MIKVKPIEWTDESNTILGMTYFGSFSIGYARSYYLTWLPTGLYLGSFKSLQEAKDAAQDHFNGAVIKCLEGVK